MTLVGRGAALWRYHWLERIEVDITGAGRVTSRQAGGFTIEAKIRGAGDITS